MKRSEMIEKIEQAIGNYALDTFKKDGNLDHINEYDLAIKILERVEEAGIMPPPFYEKVPDTPFGMPSLATNVRKREDGTYEGVKAVYKWENE